MASEAGTATWKQEIEFPKGFFMSYYVTTQAANEIEVLLKDSKKTYINGSRQMTDIEPPLAQGYADLEGDNLILTISVKGGM